MNFNQLYYFLKIAEEGSIVRASKILHITQPALSHQLRNLEEDFGKKLFDRVGKRLVLNENGALALEYAHKIFRQSDELLHLIETGSIQRETIVKIGAVNWLPRKLVFDFIHPLVFNRHIRAIVVHKDLDLLFDDLKNEQIDILLCDSAYAEKSQKYKTQRLGLDPILCVCSQHLKGKFPQNLQEQKIITYGDECMTSHKIENFLEDHQISSSIVGEFSDMALVLEAVLSGDTCAFLPFTVVKKYLKDGQLYKLGTLQDMKFSFWSITPKNQGRKGVIPDLIRRFKNKYRQS